VTTDSAMDPEEYYVDEQQMIAEILGSNAENIRRMGDLMELHHNRIGSLERRIDALEQIKTRTPYKPC